MAGRFFYRTKEIIRKYAFDLRLFIWMNSMTLIIVCANVDSNGTNKNSWAATMSPTIIHDVCSLLGAMVYTNNFYPKRPILRTVAFYHMKKFYLSIAILKTLFDVLLCCELEGITSNGAMLTASPLLLLVAILFGKHVWASTLSEEPVRM
eukprot:m.160518 g.160518  ORF g.160518 m.160518 type:complete len:150 (+) comp18028_c0_seq2:382-831(+)